MVHVALGCRRATGCRAPGLARRAQRGQGEHLGLAAGEQAGAVGARAEIDFAPDRADIGRGRGRRCACPVPGCGCARLLYTVIEGRLQLPDQSSCVFAGQFGDQVFSSAGRGRHYAGTCRRAGRAVQPRRRRHPARHGSPDFLVRLVGRVAALGLADSAAISSCRSISGWMAW